MKINSYVIGDTRISLGEADIPLLSGCKPLNATQVYGSSPKLKFYCSSGRICTLKMKDDNFSDITGIKV